MTTRVLDSNAGDMSQSGASFPSLSQRMADQKRLDMLLHLGMARSLRMGAGLSLAAVAAEVGVTAPTVWKWEQGLARPRPEATTKYLALLDSLMGVAA